MTAIVCILALAASPGADVTLEDLAAAAQANLEAITDVQVTVEKTMPNYYGPHDVREPAEAVRMTLDWAMSRDGKVFFATSAYDPVAGAPPPLSKNSVRVFDGEEGRSIAWNDEGVQTGGAILGNDELQRMVHEAPHLRTRFGHATGMRMGSTRGRSLPEWLRASGTEIMGRETVDGVSCVVVEAENGNRVYLSEEHGYALKQYESWSDGEVYSRLFVSEFSEELPGVWLPMAGYLHLHPDQPKQVEAMGRDFGVMKPKAFKVVDLTLNEPIPEELFRIEFAEGLTVVDRRFPVPGGHLMLEWPDGEYFHPHPDVAAAPDAESSLEEGYRPAFGMAGGVMLVGLTGAVARRRSRRGQ